MNFDETKLGTISNSLRVAAERFRENAATLTEAEHARLRDQFTRQADEATALYDAIATETGIAS